jgi:hypothetical protein
MSLVGVCEWVGCTNSALPGQQRCRKHIEVVPASDYVPEAIKAMATEKLAEALAHKFQTIASDMLDMAYMVLELENRDYDFTPLRGVGLLRWLRLIAYKQLDPRLVVKFQGNEKLLEAAARLPRPEQEKLAEKDNVLCIVIRDGKPDPVLADPLDLTPSQRRLVFAPDHIRDRAEQTRIVEDDLYKEQKKKRKKPTEIGPLKIDYERSGVMVGRIYISLALLKRAVRLLEKFAA